MGLFPSTKCLPQAISAPAGTLPRRPCRPERRGSARSALTFQQVRVHGAQHVGDPQLLAGTGATVDVQPGRLGEGSAQRGDGQGTRQGRGQATLRLLGQSAASRVPPPAPARQPCASGGVHARGRPPSLRGRCWSPPTSAESTEPACPGGGEQRAGFAEVRLAQGCQGQHRRMGVGPRAEAETGELQRFGGRGQGPWCGAAEVQDDDPERAGGPLDLGRAEWGEGLGRSYLLVVEERPGLGVLARGCRGAEDQAGPQGSGTQDLGTAIWGATCVQRGPTPHRLLILTGQQASVPGWRRSVPSRAPQLPRDERSQATNQQRPNQPGPDPLPASSTSAPASSGSPPSPPRATQPGRAAGSLRKASRDL